MARSAPIIWLMLALAALTQAYGQAATPLITQTIDDSKVVTLKGTVHPLAQARYDLGAVADSFSTGRLLLMLNLPAGRETALQQFLRNAHHRGAAGYHRWVTPQQFGLRFGPADADIQTAVTWLQTQGFNVAGVKQSRRFIEFSGTAGQLRRAFHTEIHKYSVEGEIHYANATEIAIPAALAPLVGGVSPLNDFHAQPLVEKLGRASYSRSTKKIIPQWTLPNPFGSGNFYALAPEDFATQYDLGPLYQAGVKGSGQTIGIINESNIDISLVNAYRQLFGLPSNPTQVVIDGNDPGTLEGVDVEAYLDVEVSGAVAPEATVNLYIAGGPAVVTLETDPLVFAAMRAIEDNQASVLSLSFGSCEFLLGDTGNQFWAALWEQAAAQGQTVFVSAGDSGPICIVPLPANSGLLNLGLGLAVSGLASTPWNIAVGGTDFYYSDYASGAPSAATLWNQNNDSDLGSLKAPLTEQGWSDGFGFDVVFGENVGAAGGGGASNCVVQSLNPLACTSGYAKPNWQTGSGVPADGVRDLPDISLFSANGANLSAYPVCAYDGECASGASSEIFLVGGTSASSPAMAAIMTLVNQKYGRQGQANFTLYPLAQQMPSAFHDITLGGNQVICPGPPTGCAIAWNGLLGTIAYPASAGYDLATGLGSVDASVLVNNWNSVTFLPTATTLGLSANQITHGTPITVTTAVSATSGSGTPTGDVAILTNSAGPSSQGQTFFTLNGGTATGSVDSFPGGTYQVTAAYHGDGVYGGSTSPSVSLTVTPENANINFQVLNGLGAVTSGGSVTYGSPVSLGIQPVGVSAAAGTTDGKATGTATFTLDSTTVTMPLSVSGVATWIPPALALGTHTASATYSGDASFNGASASPVTFTVAQGRPFVFINLDAAVTFPVNGSPTIYVSPGGTLNANILMLSGFAASGTAGPTGTVTGCLGLTQQACVNPIYSQTATLASPAGLYNHDSTAAVTFSNLAAGTYFASATYSGDANWQSASVSDNLDILVTATPPAPAASTTTLSISPASFSGTELTTLTSTVTGSAGFAPSGLVTLFDDGLTFFTAQLTPPATGVTSTASVQLDPSYFWNSGANQITAIYQGDPNYQPSTSNVVSVTVGQNQDFSLAPLLPQIAVQSGQSVTVAVNLGSLNQFSGTVTLSCAPSAGSLSCSVNPSSTTLNGTATATLTINASVQSSELHWPGGRDGGRGWLGAGFGFACGLIWLGTLSGAKDKKNWMIGLGLLGALLLSAGCGSSSSLPPSQVTTPTPAGNYSVVVTGTANGIVHNAKVLVVVQ